MIKELRKRVEKAQTQHETIRTIALGLCDNESVTEVFEDPFDLHPSELIGTYQTRQSILQRRGLHCPGIEETILGFQETETPLRAFCLKARSGTGFIWFGTDGKLIGAIDAISSEAPL